MATNGTFIDTLQPQAALRMLLLVRNGMAANHFGSLLLYIPHPFAVAFPMLFNKVTLHIYCVQARRTTCTFDTRLTECNINIWDPTDDLFEQFMAPFGPSIRNLFIVNHGGARPAVMPNYFKVYTVILTHCTRDGTIRFKKLGLHLTEHCTNAVRVRMVLMLERVRGTVHFLRINGHMPGNNYIACFHRAIGAFTLLKLYIMGIPKVEANPSTERILEERL